MSERPPELDHEEFLDKAQSLARLVRGLAARGFMPATSSNVSARLVHSPGCIAVSASGIAKDEFDATHVLAVDLEGLPVHAPHSGTPSAETRLHTALYEDPTVGVVIHTHSLAATAVSRRHGAGKTLSFANLEILKAFAGNHTHETTESIPIFANSQDVTALAEVVATYLRAHPKSRGYLIEGHGLYTWGPDFSTARRHLDALEYLLQLHVLETSWPN